MAASHIPKPAPKVLTDGDFVSYVEHGTTPGDVKRPEGMRASFIAADAIITQSHRSVAGWFVSLLTASVLSMLAYFALVNGRIVLGGRSGASEFEGGAAIAVAFFLLALSMIALWRLARQTRFSHKVAWTLLSTWLAIFVTYMLSHL